MDISVNLNPPYPATAAQGSAPSVPVAPAKSESAIVTATPPKRAELEQAVKNIQDYVTAAQRNLEFSIDDSTHQVVVKVIATDSGEVIRQLPTEAALKLAQSLADGNSTLLNTSV